MAKSQNETITLYQWILQQFTLAGRADFVKYLRPHLLSLVQSGDRALDLCCGAGPFAFVLEEQGVTVTAIDFAPYMIDLARQEASRRQSKVDFIQADVLGYDLGVGQFDLAVFLGNTVSDFPLERFIQLGHKVSQALRPSGRFAVHYVDGLYPFVAETYLKESVQQEQPERITRHFKTYVPESAAYIEVYRNEATGESYDYTSYIYTLPTVRLAMVGMFELEQSIWLSERSYLDVFVKK